MVNTALSAFTKGCRLLSFDFMNNNQTINGFFPKGKPHSSRGAGV